MAPRLLFPVVAVLAIGALVGCAGSDDAGSPAPATVSTGAGSDTTTSVAAADPAATRSSDGCGTEPAALEPDDVLGDAELTFDSEGTERSYRLAVPADYDPEVATPVVLNLHGSGSNALQQSVYSGLPKVGAEDGWLVVSPDAIAGQWELTDSGADDTFLTGLLDSIEDRYCVDLDRVHATGISLGSWKATITACTHPDRFASIALVAESVAPPGCDVPVVAFHGTADRVVPYGEGADEGVEVTGSNARLPGVEVNLPEWAANAGCDEEPDRSPIGDDVEHWVFGGCPEGEGVEFYRIAGGGHTWPGTELDIEAMGPRTLTIDATEIALDWFDRHRLAD